MLVFEPFADEAIAASELKPNSTVLDVACGPGTLVFRLALSWLEETLPTLKISLTSDAWLGMNEKGMLHHFNG